MPQATQAPRHFLSTAAISVAAAQLAMIASAEADSGETELAGVPAMKPGAGVGHNVPQEAPQAFADATVAVDAYEHS